MTILPTRILDLPVFTAAFTIVNNEDWRDAVQFAAADNGIIDVSGIHFFLQMRQAPGDARTFIDASSEYGNNRIVTEGETGTVGFYVNATDVAKVPAGLYVADLVAQANGVTKVVGKDLRITVDQGVTRPGPAPVYYPPPNEHVYS